MIPTESCERSEGRADDRLLIPAREAARMMSVSDRHLWGVTHPRGSLVPVRIGARCLYSPETLRAWIAAQTASTST